jgi:hemoglobin/transferrin/lactoferrin receptor protein
VKKLYVLLLCLACGLYAGGQTIKIVDQNFNPIENVVLLSSDSAVIKYTDSKGKIDIAEFKSATGITIKTLGFHTIQTSYNHLALQTKPVVMNVNYKSLADVVISASRFEEKRVDVPQRIEVIDRRKIEFMNQQTTAELLQQSGQVLVQKSQLGGGSPIIRGFEANKVLIVVDGVRMNNAVFRGGHLQNVITMDNSILDRTEILFGPGSVIYGSDALGGVMHFYTRSPLLSDSVGKVRLSANAYTRYSTAYDEKTGHVDFNIGFKKLAFLSSITYSDFGDLRQGNIRNDFYGDWGKRIYYAERFDGRDSMVLNSNPNIQVKTAYKQYDVLEKIIYKQNDRITHALNFQYSTSSDIPRYDRLTETNAKGILRSAEWYYGPQERMMLSYSLIMKDSVKLYDEARIILSQQFIEESRHNRNFKSVNLNHRIENIQVSGVNVDYTKSLGNHKINYGLENYFNGVKTRAYYEDIITGSTGALDTRYPSGGATMSSFGAYVTHTLLVKKWFRVNEGIRYSDVKLNASFSDTTFFPFPFKDVSQHSNALNGNLGLTFLPGYEWKISLLGATGFRAPNVDDLAKVFESVPGSIIVPNPGLKPEYTYNIDLSMSKTIIEKVTLEGTVFYTWYKDALTVKPFSFNGSDSIVYNGIKSRVISTVNAGEAYIYGTSFSLIANITNAFSITSSINYTYGRIKTDTAGYPLDHIPPVFGRTGFALNVGRLQSEFFVLYNGWKRLGDYNVIGEDNIQYATPRGTPAWFTLNIRTSYALTQNIKIQLAVENILDQNYRVFASGISAPGRNLALTLRARF